MSSHPRTSCLSTVASLLLLATALAVVPASSQEDVPSTFGEVVDVRVINLEVIVTDKKGNRVSGLAPGDFQLFVDNVEQPVDYFSEVLGGTAAPADAQPLEATSLPALAAGEPVATRYLVFIDDYYTYGSQRNIVLKNLRQHVALLNPEDSMAIVAFNGKRLELLTSWTNSSNELERALQAASKRPALGAHRQSERLRLGIETVPNPGLLRQEFVNEVDAIVSTLRGFAQPPGRKVLMLLAGAWPVRLDDDVLTNARQDAQEEANGAGGSGAPGAAEDTNNTALEFFSTSGFLGVDDDRASDLDVVQTITETANLLGYSIYPLDVPANRFSGADARTDPISNDQIIAAAQDGSTFGGVASDLERQGTLRFIADQTGGRALLGSNRLTNLETVVEDTRSYYWLGFNADRQGDDRSRKIRVETRNPEFKVRTRESYRDLSRTAEVTMLVQSAVLFGDAEIFAPSQLEARPGEVRKAKRGKMEVPIEVEVPIGELTALPGGKGWTIDAELRIAAINEDGEQSAAPIVPLRLSIPEEPAPGSRARYATSVTVRRQPTDFVISLHDPATGKVMMRSFEVVP